MVNNMSPSQKGVSNPLFGDNSEETRSPRDSQESELPTSDTPVFYTPSIYSDIENFSEFTAANESLLESHPSSEQSRRILRAQNLPLSPSRLSSSHDKHDQRALAREILESPEKIHTSLALLSTVQFASRLHLPTARDSFAFDHLEARDLDFPQRPSTLLNRLFPDFKLTDLVLESELEKIRQGIPPHNSLKDPRNQKMATRDMSGFRAVELPEPSLPTARMGTLCRDEVFGACRKTGCRHSHDLCLIEEIEAQRRKRATIRARETVLLRTGPRAASAKTRAAPSSYLEPPADGSPHGPRHDNDFLEVEDISLLPTTDEILSRRLPFLPEKDRCFGAGVGLDQSDVRRLAGLLFRHLRFDALESAMDLVHTGLQLVLRHGPAPGRGLPFRQESASGTKLSLFLDVTLDHFAFVERYGACIQCSFPCPRELRGRGLKESGVLEPGMLVCLVTFDRVTKQIGTAFLQTVDRLPSDEGEPPRAGVVASFADPDDIGKIRELLYAAHIHADGLVVGLVDCGSIMPAGFVHHLRRLRQFCSSAAADGFSGTSPLARALLASQGGSIKTASPPYSANGDFVWDLGGLPCVAADDKTTNTTTAAAAVASGQPLLLRAGVDKSVAIERIRRASTLDEGQVDALYNNLTRELAFTQGPPGTGKSFLATCTAKVLLDSLVQAERGPLLVVTQTNHSLDDALEALLARGVQKVARMGAGSNSARLNEHHLLRDLVRGRKLTPAEKTQSSVVARRLSERLEAGQALAGAWIKSSPRGAGLYQADAAAIPAWQSFATREAVATTAASSTQQETQAGRAGRPEGSEAKRAKKIAMQNQFLALTKPQQCDAFAEFHRRWRVAQDEKFKMKDTLDANTASKMDVVGLTSTGAASMYAMILKLKPKILLIEEASELTEAHTLCALFPTVQHVIAIGDPYQLRPHITERVLYTDTSPLFRLDESLFERLVKMNFPFSRLNVQRRAHPDLASLIQATDYPFVTNHPSTEQRPEARGMYRRLQWMTHEMPETFGGVEGMKSYTNQWEAEYIRELSRYLTIGQKYRIGDVTVLTPYNGQVALMKSLFEKVPTDYYLKKSEAVRILKSGIDLGPEFGTEEADILAELERRAAARETVPMNLAVLVHITTIDNYQGEQAPVVIFSPVRSNESQQIGFVANRNRINVAVSRARDGFFVIGNLRSLTTCKIWEKVALKMMQHGSVDTGILVECLDHPQNAYKVKSCEPMSFMPGHPESRCPKCRRGAPVEDWIPNVATVLADDSNPPSERDEEEEQDTQLQLQFSQMRAQSPTSTAAYHNRDSILDERDDFSHSNM